MKVKRWLEHSPKLRSSELVLSYYVNNSITLGGAVGFSYSIYRNFLLLLIHNFKHWTNLSLTKESVDAGSSRVRATI